MSKHNITRILFCVIPLIIACVVVLLNKNNIMLFESNAFFEIVKVVVDIKGTILGFIISAVSILVAFNGSKLTEEIKQTGHFKTVLVVYLTTCFELLVSIVFCVCILIANVYSLIIGMLFSILSILAALYVLLCLFFLCLVVHTIYNDK